MQLTWQPSLLNSANLPARMRHFAAPCVAVYLVLGTLWQSLLTQSRWSMHLLRHRYHPRRCCLLLLHHQRAWPELRAACKSSIQNSLLRCWIYELMMSTDKDDGITFLMDMRFSCASLSL